jgi:hypothetical protein
MRLHASVLLVALAVAAPAGADIVDSKDERQLSLSGSNFRIAIPREDWVVTREQTRTDGRSVYYALTSPKREMTLWVFIDQTPVCQSAKACLELAMKNKAYDGAADMKFFDHEGFSAVQFTLEPAKDAPMQQHLIAATYVDGAWVDLHLSQAMKAGVDPNALAALLKLLAVK